MPARRSRRFGRVFRRNGAWWARWRYLGRERTKKIGPTRKLAEQYLAGIQATIAREQALGVRTVAKVTLLQAWRKMEAARRAELSPRGFASQRDHVAAAAAYFGGKAVRDIEPGDVRSFLARLASEGRKPATLNRYLTSLRTVLADAVTRGFARVNAADGVSRYREQLPPTPFLGEEGVLRLAAAAPPLLRPVVLILADTGLRRGEALDLRRRDVDLGRATVAVQASKTGKGREIPLTRRAAAEFAALLAEPGDPADPVFAAIIGRARIRKSAGRGRPRSPMDARARAETWLSKSVSRLADRAGLEGVTLHTLRHSAASRMVAAGVPLSFVAKVTGHSTLSCAARYGRHAPADAARQAIAALEAADGGIVAAPSEAPKPPRSGAARHG